MTINEVNINDLLKEEYIVPESVFDRKRTKTSHFMLNSIFPNSSLISTEYYVNAFLNDEEFKHTLVRPIFVLFRTDEKDSKWNAIQTRLRSKPEYILDYICGTQNDKLLIMMVFEVPLAFAKDYILFKKGKYSEFSEQYKKLFNRYSHNDKAQPVESTIWRVITKSNELREELVRFFSISDHYKFDSTDELWGIAEPQYEHYRHKSNKRASDNSITI